MSRVPTSRLFVSTDGQYFATSIDDPEGILFLSAYVRAVTLKIGFDISYVHTLRQELFKYLKQGISEPTFFGDLVYKFKRIVGKSDFSEQLKKIVKRYISVGYNLDVMRQSVCLVLNPITVYSYGFLFNCTTVGQASDSTTALTRSFNRWLGA